jgi:hypothetical protein
MKRWSPILLAVLVVAATGVRALTYRPLAAAEDDMISRDKAATAALAEGDKAAAEKYLDADFSWIDTLGVMRF